MKIKLAKEEIESASIHQLQRISGEDLKKCYQCGNCSGGCPVSFEMDIAPSQVMRFLQLGKIEEVMKANSMWVCVGCLQCYSRCPKGCSVAAVLEGLRQTVLRKGEDFEKIKEIPIPFLEKAPQQAIVCGFRKLVS
ncbi:MAG: 4Fe-4S dicluster domain-containing protein [Deltaproteobacteria bacterium]|nr:4Fe-4S dicluster domain-containing protein [Deltaproteobacteria bacterium]